MNTWLASGFLRTPLARWASTSGLRWRLAVVVALSSPLAAQSTGNAKQEVRRTLRFTTTEGTWMSVDVSPDGGTLVFDLLGQLYTLPIEGGTARSLLPVDWQWDRCPRFSPDGKQIAFVSDRGGYNDLWLLNVTTGHLRRATEVERLPAPGVGLGGVACTPQWLPAGDEIAFSTLLGQEPRARVVSAAGNAGRWLAMAGAKVPISAGIPVFAPDGRTAFYAMYQSVPGREGGAVQQHRLYRLDLPSGTPTLLTDSASTYSEHTPQLSASGRWLAYCRQVRVGKAELRVRDLTTGADRRLIELAHADDPHARTVNERRSLPGYAFTPDERFIVIWFDGQLHKVTVADGRAQVIPFVVHVERTVAEPMRPRRRLKDGPIRVRALHWPSVSADRRTLIFSAAGAVWARSLPNGAPRRLTTGLEFETMPALSSDGTEVAFIAFPHTENAILAPGRLLIRTLPNGRVRSAIDDGATYYVPNWSPDGTRLAVMRQDNTTAAGRRFTWGWIDLATKSFHGIAPATSFEESARRSFYPPRISWSADGQYLFFPRYQGDTLVLEAARWDSTGRRTLAVAGIDVHQIVPSPDLARMLLIGWDQQAYVVDWPAATGGAAPLSIGMPGARRMSDIGALYPRWTTNGHVTFGWMDRLFEYRAGAARASQLAHTTLQVSRRMGQGVLAFTNARLVTMAGRKGAGEVIERGTIVIQGRRILAVGPTDRVAVPKDARTIDATGLTIIPGLIDVHYHGLHPPQGRFPSPGAVLSGDISLAYGVTTGFDPGGAVPDTEEWQIVFETGQLRGSRFLIAPFEMPLGSPRGVLQSLPAVREEVRRKASYAGGPCMKEIMEFDRVRSRHFARAALESNFCVVVHPAYPSAQLSSVVDGLNPHHWPYATPLYNDVIQFLAQADAIVTSDVFTASDLQPNLRDYLKEHLDASEWSRIEQHASRLPFLPWKGSATPFEGTLYPSILADYQRLLNAGVRVAASDHGFRGFRGEIFLWQLGGVSRADILRSATLTPAEELGLDADLGSLEAGKIADLLVLRANPLDDVVNVVKLKWTVIDGVVYDSDRLSVVHPSAIKGGR